MTPEDRAQDQKAWADAITLLTGSGMPERQARSFFGRLVSKAGAARALLPALQAAERCGTGDPVSYLSKAAQSVKSGANDPALKCDWS